MDIYSQLNSGLYLCFCKYEGNWMKKCCPGCCVCTENVGELLPFFYYDMGPGMPEILRRNSKVLVFIVPEIHMDVYSQPHSGLYLGLCRYEGIRVKRSCPGCCVCTENVGEVLPVFYMWVQDA